MYIENKLVKKYISLWLIIMFLLVAIIIIVGGLTRLTDSGLSITEWQLFSGIFPPINHDDWTKYFNLYKKIPEFEIQNYSMTLSEFKVIFWWEYIHRILGRLIGISFILPLLYFTHKVGFKNLINLYLIFLLICIQGFIGWFMVSSGLVDRVDVSHFRLSVHLLLAFIILSLILLNFLKLINVNFPNDNDIKDLFLLDSFDNPSLVQFIHRNLAYLIFIFYIIILFKIYSSKLLRFFSVIKLIGFFLFLQIILGILTLLSGAEIYLSSMHQISSIFLVSSSVYFLYLNSNSN